MIRSYACVVCAGMLLVAAAQDARAALIFTVEESVGIVIVTGSGTVDVTDLTFVGTSAVANPAIAPSVAGFAVGEAPQDVDVYSAVFSGPSTFGPGGVTEASGGIGHFFALIATDGILLVPEGYTSGAPLQGVSGYLGHTFASLGLTPGTYVWTWGAGVSTDSITLQIGRAVPEPAVFLLATFGLTAVAVRRRLSRRQRI